MFEPQKWVIEQKIIGQIPMVTVNSWFLCHFCLKGHVFLKGYSWFSNYVIIANDTQGCFLMGNLDTSDLFGRLQMAWWWYMYLFCVADVVLVMLYCFIVKGLFWVEGWVD